MSGLSVRVEHGACGSILGLAQDLVALADRLDLTVICKVNDQDDMFAMPGEKYEDVHGRWMLMQRWRHR